MANTTNYNWETPDDTDLVKDGAAAIRTLGSSVDTTTKALNPSTTLGDIEYRSSTANTNTRLAIGTTGQVLSVVGGVPAWATSDDANAIQNAIVDAKGDLIGASAADTPARLAVGTNGQVLVADSTETTGLKWAVDPTTDVITTAGDLLYGTAADTVARLGIGTAGQVLKVNSGATAPEWGAAGGGGGLVFISSTTIGTSVTSITVSSAFSSTYNNYKIIVSGGSAAEDCSIFLQLGSTTSGYYGWSLEGSSSASTVTGTPRSNVDNFKSPFGGSTNGLSGIVELQGPNMAERTALYGQRIRLSTPGAVILTNGFENSDTQHTAFTILSDTAMTGGTIKVYGYANS